MFCNLDVSLVNCKIKIFWLQSLLETKHIVKPHFHTSPRLVMMCCVSFGLCGWKSLKVESSDSNDEVGDNQESDNRSGSQDSEQSDGQAAHGCAPISIPDIITVLCMCDLNPHMMGLLARF
jgi:hypothetical protein